MRKTTGIFLVLVSMLALSACSSGSSDSAKTSPGAQSSVKSSDTAVTAAYTGKVDDDKKPYELGGDKLSNKELESFLKDKMGVQSVGKLGGQFMFSDDSMIRYGWLLSFENDHSLKQASATLKNGVQITFGPDFKITAQTGGTVDTSKAQTYSDQLTKWANMQKITSVCTPGFESLQKCAESKGLTVVPAAGFDEFYRDGKYESILQKITDDAGKTAAIGFFQKKLDEEKAKIQKESTTNIATPEQYVGKSVFDILTK